MIIRDIKTKQLFDAKYDVESDEYWIYCGETIVRKIKPALFRYILYDREPEYIIEKDIF